VSLFQHAAELLRACPLQHLLFEPTLPLAVPSNFRSAFLSFQSTHSL
jgi:hypothetical protein